MVDFYIKSESSLNNKIGFGNYTGIGAKQENYWGTNEIMYARRFNSSGQNDFLEFKYTTPKVGDFALEFRDRHQQDCVTERIALKVNKEFDNNWSIYGLAGANHKLQKEGKPQTTPVFIAGANHKFNRVNVYGEFEYSNFTPFANIGVKITF